MHRTRALVNIKKTTVGTNVFYPDNYRRLPINLNVMPLGMTVGRCALIRIKEMRDISVMRSLCVCINPTRTNPLTNSGCDERHFQNWSIQMWYSTVFRVSLISIRRVDFFFFFFLRSTRRFWICAIISRIVPRPLSRLISASTCRFTRVCPRGLSVSASCVRNAQLRNRQIRNNAS